MLAIDDLGDTSEMWRLGMHAKDTGNERTAKFWWSTAANLGNHDAMYNLGVLAYEAGSVEYAKSWYQKAADLGNEDASSALEELGES